MPQSPLVCIVDDDPSVREGTQSLLRAVGCEVETFASASAFLTSGRLQDCSCLVLDVQMPDQSGLALHKHLISLGLDVPVVFVTAFPSERARLQALKAGAVCYLPKPIDEEVLISCVRHAVGLRKM